MYELPRWVNGACAAAGVPWIGRPGAAARAPRPDVPPRRIGLPGVPRARRADPLYDELASWRQAHQTVARTLGWASGLVGSLLAGEVAHLLTGATEPATVGTAITIDLHTLRTTRERVERDLACPACS
jgi:hypothetical protein